MAQFILIGMRTGIKMSTIRPLFTSKCQHGQYRTLKVKYLSPMLVFTKIIVLYNFRYKKLSKPCTQLLRYKQPVPYLPVNTSMDNIVLLKWSVSNAGIYEKYFISNTRNSPNHVYNY